MSDPQAAFDPPDTAPPLPPSVVAPAGKGDAPAKSLDDMTGGGDAQYDAITKADLALTTKKIGAEAGMEAQRKRSDDAYAARQERMLAQEGATMEDLKPWNAAKELNSRKTDLWEQFGSPGFIVAMLASTFTAMPMNSALNAGAAAMNAINQNDMDSYNKAFDAWKENSNLTIKRLDIEEHEFEQIDHLRTKNMESWRASASALAARFNDQRMQIMLANGYDQQALEARDALTKSKVELSDATQRLQENEIRRQVTMALLGDSKDPKKMAQAAADAEMITTAPKTPEQMAVNAVISQPGFRDLPNTDQNKQIQDAIRGIASARYGGRSSPVSAEEQRQIDAWDAEHPQALQPERDAAHVDILKKVSTAAKPAGANTLSAANIPDIMKKFEEVRGAPVPPEMKAIIESAFSAKGINAPARIAAVNDVLGKIQAAKDSGKLLDDKQQISMLNGAVSLANTAYARAGGTYAARVDSATSELQQTIPQAIESSRALPRTAYTKLNSLLQEFQKGTSDPQYYDALAATWTVLNAYARAINPTGVPRETEKAELRSEQMISLVTDELSYETVMRRMMKEANASQTASHKVMTGTVEPVDIDKSLGPLPVKVGSNTAKDPESTRYKKDGWIWEKQGNLLVPIQSLSGDQ